MARKDKIPARLTAIPLKAIDYISALDFLRESWATKREILEYIFVTIQSVNFVDNV